MDILELYTYIDFIKYFSPMILFYLIFYNNPFVIIKSCGKHEDILNF